MAPKRGGGGGSSGSSGGSGIDVSCPDPFEYGLYSTPLVYFVNYCIFFVLILFVAIGMCCVWKRHRPARKLAGPIYLLSLLCMLIGYGLLIIATMLRECKKIYQSFYEWAIAYSIFFSLGNYLLLVVVVWGVNSLLRERLGSRSSLHNVAYIVILGFMGALTCAYIGLQGYNNWTQTEEGLDSDADSKGIEQTRFAIAYYVFYLLSVLGAGGLAIASLISMRSRSIPYGDLLGWVIALIFCMFIWLLFTIIDFGTTLDYDSLLDREAYYAFAYIENFFQLFSWIIILFIAKSRVWNNTAVANPVPQMYPAYPQQQPVQYAPVPPPQQQYAYNAAPGQQYYYQQQPVHHGTPSPVNGYPQAVQVK